MVINKNKGTILTKRLLKANNFWRRLIGLLPYKNIGPDIGLLLTPCNSVHTFFMRFTIDVLYLDASMKVIAAYPGVQPWKALPIQRKGKHVLEIPPGMIAASQTAIGDSLHIVV